MIGGKAGSPSRPF